MFVKGVRMEFDYVLVGGGLQNALIALAVLERRPDARIALVERGGRLGGNHTWSFHAEDVPEAARTFVDRLVVARWPGFDVAFPEVVRTFDAEYASVSSDRLHEVVSARFGACLDGRSRLILDQSVTSVSEHEVALESGERVRGQLVVDARGPERGQDLGKVGWQKFLGLELSLRTETTMERPILMDATVAQTDGFRFLYVLPLARDRVLVEDTYFADDRALDVPARRAEILAYASRLGLDVGSIVREEIGFLPLPLRMDEALRGWTFAPQTTGPLVAGFQGGFFHPTTAYSFPIALRLAQYVASVAPSDVFGASFHSFLAAHARQVRFALMLNRLLFEATPPHHRRDVLERFHRLPEATVRRFYAMTTTATDRARIVCGRPPKGVSIRAALAQMVSS